MAKLWSFPFLFKLVLQFFIIFNNFSFSFRAFNDRFSFSCTNVIAWRGLGETNSQSLSKSSLLSMSQKDVGEKDKTVVTTSDVFSLDSIRSTLVRQEETIIFALIERAQYRKNKSIYDSNTNNLLNLEGKPVSFLEWMLLETEKLHVSFTFTLINQFQRSFSPLSLHINSA